jgi:hypothetical protein
LELTLSPRKLYSFYINDAQAAGLKAIKKERDISESEQIRQALNDWLAKHGVSITPAKTERKRAATRKRPFGTHRK